MTVDVEILCIGNELLIGKIMDTNAHWLAQQITALGANVRRITVIPDSVDEIATAINEIAARKPQFLITTGGLGPTFDDMTLQGVAKALNRKLEVNPKALEMVKAKIIEYAKKRGLPVDVEMTPPRLKMATMPENIDVVTNPIGTAPGAHADIDGTALFVLPGVPAEMEGIFAQTIAPLIKKAAGSGVFCQRSVFTEGIIESVLAPLIDEVMRGNPGVYVKSHPLKSDGNALEELHLTINAGEECKPAEAIKKATTQLIGLIKANGGIILSET
ncbi:MAG: molybdopterin-binding protein [Candidatus Bathyarchaeia archaeon]